MASITLNPETAKLSAVCLAEASRALPKGEDEDRAKASRSLARLLAEEYTRILARGEVLFILSDREAAALSAALWEAASRPARYAGLLRIDARKARALAATILA